MQKLGTSVIKRAFSLMLREVLKTKVFIIFINTQEIRKVSI